MKAMNRLFLTSTVTLVVVVSATQAQKTVPQMPEALTRQEHGQKVMNRFS